MKHLKKFENFNLQDEEELRPTTYDMQLDEEEEEMYPQEEEEENFEDEEMRQSQEEITLEKKKSKGMPPWLKKGKNDKDDKKEDKKDKGGKGLSAAQKRLPEGLRKAIEARKKK